MKTKEEFLEIIEKVVHDLGNTIYGGGKFLLDDDVDEFWETMRSRCGLRVVSPSSFEVRVVFAILSAYTRARKRKGYDCACEIAENIFKACSSTVIAALFKTPFENNFKRAKHQSSFPFGHGFSIRYNHVRDFASASADIILSLGTGTGITSDLESRIFDLLVKHKGKQNDQDLVEAIVQDLEKSLQANL